MQLGCPKIQRAYGQSLATTSNRIILCTLDERSSFLVGWAMYGSERDSNPPISSLQAGPDFLQRQEVRQAAGGPLGSRPRYSRCRLSILQCKFQPRGRLDVRAARVRRFLAADKASTPSEGGHSASKAMGFRRKRARSCDSFWQLRHALKQEDVWWIRVVEEQRRLYQRRRGRAVEGMPLVFQPESCGER